MKPKLIMLIALFAGLAAIPAIRAEEAAGDTAEAKKKAKAEFIELTDKKTFESLVAQAKKSGKPVLIDFTGSDWCGWCIKLKKEVFSTETFAKKAPGLVHLARLDWPKKRKLDEKEKAYKETLIKKFKVKSWPTILLVDGSGKELIRTGYVKGGAENYIKHLTKIIDAAKKGKTPAPAEGSGGG